MDKNARNKEIDIVQRAINRLVKTQDGKVFINWLMKLCGFARSSIVVDPATGNICAEASAYNEARKTVYYRIRSLIKPDDLYEIEYLQIKEDSVNEI